MIEYENDMFIACSFDTPHFVKINRLTNTFTMIGDPVAHENGYSDLQLIKGFDMS